MSAEARSISYSELPSPGIEKSGSRIIADSSVGIPSNRKSFKLRNQSLSGANDNNSSNENQVSQQQKNTKTNLLGKFNYRKLKESSNNLSKTESNKPAPWIPEKIPSNKQMAKDF